MQDLNITISVISFIILVFGAVFAKIQRLPLSEPLIAMGVGILLGPHVLQVVDLNARGDESQIMVVATRFTIAMALMATALRLPLNFIIRQRKTQTFIVVAGMLAMWLHSTLLFWWIFSIDFSLAALAGAIITPTDPVIASSIVSGGFARKHLSSKVRHTLSFESGANDGLAFPLVMLPLLWLTGEPQFLETWFLHSFLWETLGGIGLGLVVGYGAGRLINAAYQRHYMTDKSLLASSLALAFLVIGSFQLLGVNSIVAVFGAGLMLNHCISKQVDLKDEKIQETMERIFVIPIFFLFGLIIPFHLWGETGWILVALVAGVLVLRRLPFFILFKKLIKGYDYIDMAVLGWLGPIGVTSLFYLFYTRETFEHEFLWTTISAVIFGSTLVHGITASPAARWYKHEHLSVEEKKKEEEFF